jgi:hypothetical protein
MIIILFSLKKNSIVQINGVGHGTLHKPALERFPRNLYRVTNIDDVWEMDLADVSSSNIMTGINIKYYTVFSRYAWSVPLKSKTDSAFSLALEQLYKYRQPITTQSDKGSEFLNVTIQNFLKKQNISYHTTHNPGKRCHI